MSGADGRLLGLPDGERDPEVLALLNILFGIILSSVREDFDPAVLRASLDWLLAQLPVPPLRPSSGTRRPDRGP